MERGAAVHAAARSGWQGALSRNWFARFPGGPPRDRARARRHQSVGWAEPDQAGEEITPAKQKAHRGVRLEVIRSRRILFSGDGHRNRTLTGAALEIEE